jgi:Ca-activated chloride channel homolog
VFRAAVGLIGVVVALQVAVQTQVRDPRTFRSAVEVTSVTVTVRDAEGRLVTDLPKERFEIYEDGDRQTLTHFTSERVPISVAVALDASDSMFGRRMDDARVAVRRFLDEQIATTDEFLLMAFNHEPRVLTPWSEDRGLAGRLLASITPTGGTAVYDAILAAVPLFAARTRQRAAVLVISDGADTASDAGIKEVRTALLRSDAFAYAVAVVAGSTRHQHTGQPDRPERHHRHQRWAHRSGAHERRDRCGSDLHRRRAEQPISARLLVVARRRRPVPQHPREGRRRDVSREGAWRLHCLSAN